MPRMRELAVAMACTLALGCGIGDDSAIRALHPTVTVGAALADVVVRAEQAQKADVAVSVTGSECPGDTIELGRSYGNPYIRITHVSSKPDAAAEPGHTEVGLPTHDAFARAVATHLPPFYGCQTFVLRFWRDHVWPTSDSFSVTVDPHGRITAVSGLKQDAFGD